MTALTLAAVSRAPLALLVVAGFVFASRIMAAKAGLGAGLDPVQLAVLGNLGAGLALLPLVLAAGERVPASPRHLVLYVGLGAVGVAVPSVLTYFVVERVGPAYTATVYALSPLLTLAFAAALGVERLSWLRLAGIVAGVLGMIALVRGQRAAVDLGAPLWVLAGLAIPACTALGNVLRTARWPAGTSALAFSCGTLIASAALLGLAAPAISAPLAWRFDAPGLGLWLAATIALSALSQVLNFRLQQVAGPVFFSQIGTWGTGFGVLLAVLLFDDVLTAPSVLGLVAIVAGGVLARRG